MWYNYIMKNKIITKVKMSPEELMKYLAFKHHGYIVPHKKGKGSYNRKKNNKIEEDN